MLVAMTTAETVKYVSDKDPAKKKVVTLNDPSDATKGEKVTFQIDEKNATTFTLTGLDVYTMGWVYDNASTFTGKHGSEELGIQTRMNQTNIEAVRLGLKGFTNFVDAKGNQLTFTTQDAVINGREYKVVSDAIMNRLGVQLVQELAAEIKKISEVTAKEEKNSGEA